MIQNTGVEAHPAKAKIEAMDVMTLASSWTGNNGFYLPTRAPLQLPLLTFL